MGLIWAYINYNGYDVVIKKKIESKRFKKYSEFDINTLRKKINSLGIEVIETNIEDKEFFENCVRMLKRHYEKVVLPNDCKNILKINNTYIAYNNNYVYILPESYKITQFHYTYSIDGIKYFYYDSKHNENYLTIYELIKKLDTLATIINNESVKIPRKKFFWQIRGLTSSSYKLASVATDAIAGGLLFGPVGAFVGASKAADKENKRDDRYGIIGEIEGKSWKVAEGYQVDYFIKDMSEHFSKSRAADVYNH